MTAGEWWSAQGVEASGERRLYARISRRLLAITVDTLVYVLSLVVLMVLVEALHGSSGVRAATVGWLAFCLLYEPLLVSRRGATVGHACANVRVVHLRTGAAPGFLRALARFWLKGLVGLLGFAFMGTTRRHQALHDLAVGTTVEIRDPAKARPWQYAEERRPASGWSLPPVWRRVAVILMYSVGTWLLFDVSLLLLESKECFERSRCSSMERTVEKMLEILFLGALAAWIIFGWRGRLPGARGRTVGQSAGPGVGAA